MDGQRYTETSQRDIKLTLRPDGEYQTWIHNGLLDSLAAAVKKIAKCEDTTWYPPNVCNPNNVGPVGFCNSRSSLITSHSALLWMIS